MDPFACGAPVAADPDETPLNVTARLQELQNSNESPLDSERPFIESVVCQLRGRLSRRDVEISRLRARIAQLEEECAGLESEISRNTSILSPIRRIPNEILSEIFPLALPSHQEAIESDGFDVQDTPWSLGQICGQWRAVALSLGALWSSVAINYGAVVGSPSAAYPLAMLETQLERANTLRIYLTPTLSPSGHELVLLHLLAGHSHRWEVLDLVLTPGIHPIIASLQNRVPQLRKLRIEWRDPDPDTALLLPDEDVESFRIAPALTDVTLITEDRFLSVPLPAHQLTRYELNGSWAAHIDILKHARNLIEARIVVDDTADSPHIVPDGVIDLCHLRRLYVSDADILDGLKLPALQELGFYHEESNSYLQHIESLLLRSSCSLRRLCTMGIGSPGASTITAVLQKNPTIVELAIILTEDQVENDVDALISDLCAVGTDGIPSIAPQLSGIFFACQDNTSLDYELYYSMLLARWNPGSFALTTAGLLTASGAIPPAPTVLLSLESLRRDGLDLLLVSGESVTTIIDEWIWHSGASG